MATAATTETRATTGIPAVVLVIPAMAMAT